MDTKDLQLIIKSIYNCDISESVSFSGIEYFCNNIIKKEKFSLINFIYTLDILSRRGIRYDGDINELKIVIGCLTKPMIYDHPRRIIGIPTMLETLNDSCNYSYWYILDVFCNRGIIV